MMLAVLQALASLVGGTTAMYVASQSSSEDAKMVYTAAGAGMLSILPYTLIFIMPTNKQLLNGEKKEDAQARMLHRSSHM